MDTNDKLKILGVRVDNLSREEILKKVDVFLAEERFHQIATVNPEFILEAQKNSEFRKVLSSTDLNVADGFGISLAFWRYGKKLRCRLAGADLLGEILRMAEEKSIPIFLAIRKDGLSSLEEIRAVLLRKYPGLVVDGEDFDMDKIDENRAVQVRRLELMMTRKTDLIAVRSLANARDGKNDRKIVFANFGAPFQEIFLNSQKNASIRLAMGVGGAFDFLTGKVRRAPKWMQNLGLEWLWRLFQAQEWKFKKERIKRIWRAVVVFGWKIIF